MPKYAVTCIDRLDGSEYTLLVEAQSAVGAKMIAAKNHIAGEVHIADEVHAEMPIRGRPLPEEPPTPVTSGAASQATAEALIAQVHQQNVMLYQQLQAMRIEQAQRHQQVNGFNLVRILIAVGLVLLILFVCAGFAANLLPRR